MPTRRDFLAGLSALGLGPALSAAAPALETDSLSPATEAIPLQRWQFRLDPDAAFSAQSAASGENWQPVTVPHTWQVLGQSPDYAGAAWYRLEVHAPAAWQRRFVRVEFEAVYHSAWVYLNGILVGDHIGKGYTAFTCDLTPHLRFDALNILAVRVDNSFSSSMLPRMKSFDWANDGGLTRPVRLLVSPPIFIESIAVRPNLDLDSGAATVIAHATVRNTQTARAFFQLAALLRDPQGQVHTTPAKSAEIPANGVGTVALPPVSIDSPLLWHFDAPNLYTAEITISSDSVIHSASDTFGIRRFEARGTAFYLNGERVSLMGVERMAGSHPEYGMAEPSFWIQANHRDMKELNCVFTRVHWPQDRRVLDFCDRHGILIQTEVPAWGPETFANTSAAQQEQLTTNGLEQLREMITRDGNHPSIVSWGLCNEVDGHNPNSRAFASALAAEGRHLDPSRLLTYASHSLRDDAAHDMAAEFDFISANEYYGSWYPGGVPELTRHISDLRHAFPDKPIVISEYGWCECQPTLPPGDESRVHIIDSHTEAMRASGEIAGAIYFDYNDYRTVVGDKGTGALRQRVHGVVDLYANRKPSFEHLRRQSSPIESLELASSGGQISLRIVTRSRLPGYTLRGYSVRWLFHGYDGLAVDGGLDPLPHLAPGSGFNGRHPIPTGNLTRASVDILSPTGFTIAAQALVLESA